MNKNPDTAIDAILAEGETGFVKRLTLARMALLEKIDCPLLQGKLPNRTELTWLLYVMTAPRDELKMLQGDEQKVKDAAFDWADGIEDFSKIQEWTIEVLKDFVEVADAAPKGDGDDASKKVD